MELVREGIARVIRNRMRNPRTDRAQLRADLEAFLQTHAGKGNGKHYTDDEIDELVTRARDSASNR